MTTPDGAPSSYRGRFAPSPTGPLHFGSLAAAVGSYLDARAHGGQWLLRIEDVDMPRTAPGAVGAILSALEAYGFEWDGDVMMQSQRTVAYRAALERLRYEGWVFACACTRRELADSMLDRKRGVGAPLPYPGTCRDGLAPGRQGRAFRLRVPPEAICFDDRLQGRVCQDLEREVGDFILLRADGLFAYQLAVTVDDAEQGITDIVRGADLMESTARQIHLQRLLGFPTPRYLHLPVAVNAAGEKLSKQTLAAALATAQPQPPLVAALRFLGQEPPEALVRQPLAELWGWAHAHWDAAKLPASSSVAAPPNF